MRTIFTILLLLCTLPSLPARSEVFEDRAATFVGAGDISVCGSDTDDATAALLDTIGGWVFTAGDNAYYSGTAAEYACYDASWGRHKGRTKPVIGNHDFVTGQGSVYHSYFGPGFGTPGASYYSFKITNNWLIVVLDSNIPMTATSPQGVWLENLLSTNTAVCTIALWHHPLFSSGPHGNNAWSYPIWQILYNHHVELVINGHDHDYERFAPQTPDAVADSALGIREFVVGTGGAPLYAWGTIRVNSVARDNATYGVLKLTLRTNNYTWNFVPVPGGSFTDSGTDSCRA